MVRELRNGGPGQRWGNDYHTEYRSDQETHGDILKQSLDLPSLVMWGVGGLVVDSRLKVHHRLNG